MHSHLAERSDSDHCCCLHSHWHLQPVRIYRNVPYYRVDDFLYGDCSPKDNFCPDESYWRHSSGQEKSHRLNGGNRL